MKNKDNKICRKMYLLLIILATIIVIIACAILLIMRILNGIGSAGISKEEFEEIEIGMDNFEVNAIIDKLGEWNDDEIYEKACEEVEKTKNESVYKYTYKYNGENSGYALITFEVDYSDGVYGLQYPEVVKKEQVNLK